jgi:hypothetical protein
MKATQGRRLIAALKRKPHTYLEMQMLGVSTSPQKRVMESLHFGEYVHKRINKRGLVTWRVLTATKWTA